MVIKFLKKNKRQKSKFFNYNFLKKNRKAWTTVLEVFFAILLLVGVMTIILNNGNKGYNQDEEIYKEQARILKIIQLNDSLREMVLTENLIEISQFVNNNILEDLECDVTICDLNDDCILETEQETYVDSVLIFTSETGYKPKKLKLFCWRKD